MVWSSETNVVSLPQPGAQGDSEDSMEPDESLTVPGQGNNHHQLPDTTSIRNCGPDIQTSVWLICHHNQTQSINLNQSQSVNQTASCILSCSARSAERRLELLHDVVSIRSDRSRRRPRSGQPPVQPGKTVWQRFKEVFRTVIAFVFSNVGICVLVLGYLILGRFN